MTEAIYRQCAGVQDHTPAGALLPGAILQLADGRAAVVRAELAANEKGSVATLGIFDVLAATSVTFLIGETVFWDISADTAINSADTEEGDFALGPATVAKVSGELVVRVDLNGYVAAPSKILQLAAAKTLTVADLGSTVFVDTQAGALTITLPAAASCIGRDFTFVRAGTGTNAITVDGNASETIDGSATHAAMDAARDTITIRSDGSNWFIVAARLA